MYIQYLKLKANNIIWGWANYYKTITKDWNCTLLSQCSPIPCAGFPVMCKHTNDFLKRGWHNIQHFYYRVLKQNSARKL